MNRILILLTVLLLAVPAFAKDVTFTIVGIDCEGCSKPILDALKGVKGVSNPRLDWKKGLATVDVPEDYDREKLRAAITELGFEAIFPGEQRKDIQPLAPEVLKTLDVQTDAKGKRVDVAKTVVPGKITIVDFYADWCGPCHVLETRLHHYMTSNKNIALRRVNIGKWDNAAAKQATREFRAEALPYIRVYDAKGKFVTDVTGGMWDQVLAAIDAARTGKKVQARAEEHH